jgi:hypothetical protein
VLVDENMSSPYLELSMDHPSDLCSWTVVAGAGADSRRRGREGAVTGKVSPPTGAATATWIGQAGHGGMAQSYCTATAQSLVQTQQPTGVPLKVGHGGAVQPSTQRSAGVIRLREFLASPRWMQWMDNSSFVSRSLQPKAIVPDQW